MGKKEGRRREASITSFKQFFPEASRHSLLQSRVNKIEQYLGGFSGYDPETLEPKVSGGKHSFLFLRQPFGTSVVFEPSIESKDHIREQLERSRTAAGALASQFSNLLQRVMLHTELCKALRALRKVAETSPNRSFYRAVVDIHDCARASDPEEMKEPMVGAICKIINELSPDLTDQDLYSLNEELFTVGLRPWPTHKIALKTEVPAL